MNRITIDTPLGKMTLSGEYGVITGLCFGEGEAIAPEPYLDFAAGQIIEYFAGTRKLFDLKLSPEGTNFQKKVWTALCEIPYGETRSYGSIAAVIGNPRAARAVGMACNRNPIGIIIPCHRVVGHDGSLTGYYGGLDLKAFLLRHEENLK